MTDLELMKILESNNFEPSAVNVLILKEEISNGNLVIYEGDIMSKVTGTKNAVMISNLREDSSIATDENKMKELEGKARDVAADKVAKKMTSEKKKKRTVNESFSDYELYKMLDENNFEPTIENLKILKEGLLSGDIEISESASRNYNTGGQYDVQKGKSIPSPTETKTSYTYYTDKDADPGEQRRVLTRTTVRDTVDGSTYVARETDKVNSGKSNRDYGSLNH